MMEITRRTFLKLGLMGTAGLVLPFDASVCSGSRSGSTGNLLHSKARLPKPFRFLLPVPPVLNQRAATLWYHDHRMDFTGPQAYRGLADVYLIRGEFKDSLPLPGGEKDLPLMICDRSFDEDGSFLHPSVDPSLQGEPGVTNAYMGDVLGDVILVNGAPWSFMEVSNTRYRFRVVDVSNARRYELALDPAPQDGAPFSSRSAART